VSDNFKTFVIVNPHSANGRTGKRWPELAEALKSAIGTFDSALTSRQMEAPDIARNAISKGYEMIVSVGGDGKQQRGHKRFLRRRQADKSRRGVRDHPRRHRRDLARYLGIRGLRRIWLPIRSKARFGRVRRRNGHVA